MTVPALKGDAGDPPHLLGGGDASGAGLITPEAPEVPVTEETPLGGVDPGEPRAQWDGREGGSGPQAREAGSDTPEHPDRPGSSGGKAPWRRGWLGEAYTLLKSGGGSDSPPSPSLQVGHLTGLSLAPPLRGQPERPQSSEAPRPNLSSAGRPPWEASSPPSSGQVMQLRRQLGSRARLVWLQISACSSWETLSKSLNLSVPVSSAINRDDNNKTYLMGCWED